MLYTRKGDDGTSGLFGTKARLPKDSDVFESLGTIDELNSLLGVCRASAHGAEGVIDISREVKAAQECLFILQAELAGSDKSIDDRKVAELEQTIDRVEKVIEKPKSFIVPGETALSALFDYARAVSRRAERMAIKAGLVRTISAPSRAYVNRLSSLLYALARYAAHKEGAKESRPLY